MISRYLTCLLISLSLSTFSQTDEGLLFGKISSEKEPLYNATIQIDNSNLYTTSKVNGRYMFPKIPYGKHLIKVSFVGYKPLNKTIFINKKKTKIDFKLQNELHLKEVIIKGKSKRQIKREHPIKVELINIQKLQERSSSLTQIINQTSGVKIRQTGGVGSTYKVNLNGLQGNAIRYFKNGIPTDYLGKAFELNIIPTSNIKNIEIYKGMLPTELGADALGGAININTRGKHKNYLTTSYKTGSFNLHTAAVNTNYCIPKTKFYVGLNSYIISSSNNYEIDAPIRDYDTQKLKMTTLKRFHDGINSQFLEANFGIRNSNLADILDVTFSFFNYNKQIQHGYRLESVFGEVEAKEKSKMLAFSYNKKLINKLYINLFYAHANKNQKLIDLSKNIYDWYGKVTNLEQPNKARGEVTSLKINQSIDQKINTGRLISNYKFSKNINLELSSTLSSKNKVGTDPYSLPNPRTNIQPITLPSSYTKIVSAVGLGLKLFHRKIHNEFTCKSYDLNANTISMWRFTKNKKQKHRSIGYGNATKFSIDNNTFLRLSFEKATRIPESKEYFGDNLFTVPNPQLETETSKNYNLSFRSNLDTENMFFTDINFFYRKTANFIRKVIIGMNLIHKNMDTQITKGAETTFTADFKKGIKSKLSITYQDLRMTNTLTAMEGSRTPNIPYLFSNIGFSKHFEKLLNLPINIEFYSDYSFTEQYLLLPIRKEIEPKLFQKINLKNTLIIPTQHQLNIGLTTKHNKLPVMINFQINNILNLKQYDQFKIQKPTRNFNLKITYKI